MYKELILFRNELKNKSIPKYKIIGIVSELLLSKQIFAKNADIEEFLSDVFGMKFKAYLYKSRTMVVARVTKEIVVLERDNDYKNKLYSFFENELNIQEPTTRKRKYATKQKMPMAIENIYKIDFEKYMFDNDLSTKQLAKEIGISQSTIGRILSKKLTGTTKKVYNSITSWLNNLPDSKCYLKDDTEEFVEEQEEQNDKNDNYNCSLIDSCNYSLIEKYTNIVDDLSGQAVEIISKLNNLQKDLEKINDKKSIYEELLDDLKGVEVSVTRD